MHFFSTSSFFLHIFYFPYITLKRVEQMITLSMGTFIGHLVPGLAFTLLGLWHTLNTIKLYKHQGPSNFTCTTWFPFPRIKRLELYLLLSFSLLAITFQFSDHGPLGLPDLEHATMFAHVIIYTAAALFCDASSPLVGISTASAFGQELFLLHFHSADHVGLEGHYHHLLQLVVAAAFLAAIIAIGFPCSFATALVRSATVLCQGLWFMTMGFALWVPELVPKGCYLTGSDDRRGAVECRSEDASRRAFAMANLQFSWMIAGVLIAILCLSILEDRKLREEYSQLNSHVDTRDSSVKQDNVYM